MILRGVSLAGLLALAGGFLAGCSEDPHITTRSQEARRLYDEGIAAYEKFYYREALETFEKAVAADSTFVMAWGRISQIHYRNYNEGPAKAAIAQALRYAPGASEREQLYIRLWSHMAEYRTPAAASVADSLISRYPHDKEAYLTRGQLFETERKYKDAVESYKKAIAEDSSFALAVMSLGYAYSAVGEQELAIQTMKRYIRMAPDAADPRASYADLLFFSGRYEEALTQYRKSLEIKPDYWYSFQRIGNIYTLLGRLREAEAEHLKAQEVLPVASRAKGGARMVHAMMDMYRGSYADAEQQYLHVLRDDSTAWEAAIGLCTALIRLGKFGEAEQVLNRIYDGYRRRGLESSSSIAGYHLVRAKYLTAKGELDSALVACSRAVVVAEPRARAGVYGQYAEIYLRQRSFEAALEACDVALRENPNYPPALLMLARVYHARGDTPMTEEICGRLLTLWKDADGDFRDLKEVRSLLGSRQMPA